jgi:hypothetical protein
MRLEAVIAGIICLYGAMGIDGAGDETADVPFCLTCRVVFKRGLV